MQSPGQLMPVPVIVPVPVPVGGVTVRVRWGGGPPIGGRSGALGSSLTQLDTEGTPCPFSRKSM